MLTDLPIRAEHVGDSLVDVRSQPPVQLHLLMADHLPGLPGGEVHEAEIHRFFEFESVITEEDHDADVRLFDLRPWSHRRCLRVRVCRPSNRGRDGQVASISDAGSGEWDRLPTLDSSPDYGL